MTTTKIISTASAVLVALLAIGAFILSYDALRHVALDYGIAASLVYVWPLLIDFALVVFSLAVLRANLRGEPAWWPWLLVGLFTAATVGFNLIHADGAMINHGVTRYLVAIVAPVALLLSFETLMTMLRGEITYHGAVTRLATLRQESDTLRGDIEARQTELSALRQDVEGRQTELTALRQQVEAEHAQLDALRGDIEARQAELKTLRRQIDTRRQQVETPTAPSVTIKPIPAHETSGTRRDKIIERQQQIMELVERGLSSSDIAAQLELSLRTVQRELKQLNGQVSQ